MWARGSLCLYSCWFVEFGVLFSLLAYHLSSSCYPAKDKITNKPLLSSSVVLIFWILCVLSSLNSFFPRVFEWMNEWMCMLWAHVCHSQHAVVRRQFVGVTSFLSPRGFWGSNSGCKAWWLASTFTYWTILMASPRPFTIVELRVGPRPSCFSLPSNEVVSPILCLTPNPYLKALILVILGDVSGDKQLLFLDWT